MAGATLASAPCCGRWPLLWPWGSRYYGTIATGSSWWCSQPHSKFSDFWQSCLKRHEEFWTLKDFEWVWMILILTHEFSASRVKTLLNYFCFPVAHIGYDQKWSNVCPCLSCLRWPLLSSGITGSISLRRRSSAPNSHCGWSWGRAAIEVNRCRWTSRPFASGCWWAPCWWSWTCSWLAGMGQQLDMVRTWWTCQNLQMDQCR